MQRRKAPHGPTLLITRLWAIGLEPIPRAGTHNPSRGISMLDNLSLSAEHTIKIRDLRARFGEPEVYAAECTCGWTGVRQTGPGAERVARREGIVHTDAERLASQPRR